MKVVVDYQACESNGLCMLAAPDVFDPRDDDDLYLLTEEPPAALRGAVEAAIRACPKKALGLVE